MFSVLPHFVERKQHARVFVYSVVQESSDTQFEVNMSSELLQPDGEREDAAFGPMKKISVPSTFQGWCSLISDILAPAEELSPFKLGQVKTLISEINHDVGLFVSPAFVIGQILFLIAFVGYLVTAVYSLVNDALAMSGACAAESWIWLYV